MLETLYQMAVPSILSAVLAFLLGVMWYHPKVLGKRWLEARGIEGYDLRPYKANILYTLGLWVIAAFFYTFLTVVLQMTDLSEFFLLSCLVWVAFVMPSIVMGSLYTGYPFNAVAIDASYQLAGFYVMAIIHTLVHIL